MKNDMYYNFNILSERLIDTLEKSDLVDIRNKLLSIDKSTLCCGVGGSSVVSEFASKVLSEKNHIITMNVNSRDMLYRNINCFKNIFICSYGGNNLGVDISLDNNLNKYLFSTREIDNICNLNYKSNMSKEYSFISLGATLISMAILLNYYLDGDLSIIYDVMSCDCEYKVNDNFIYEVLSGYEDSSAAKFIESTMIESGIGISVIHDKYDYCHGRSTMSYYYPSNLILFNNGSELDNLYINLLKDYYDQIIVIDKKYDDLIVNDFYFTYQSMLLCKQIAEKRNMDLSKVKYSPLVKSLYRYSGNM